MRGSLVPLIGFWYGTNDFQSSLVFFLISVLNDNAVRWQADPVSKFAQLWYRLNQSLYSGVATDAVFIPTVAIQSFGVGPFDSSLPRAGDDFQWRVVNLLAGCPGLDLPLC